MSLCTSAHCCPCPYVAVVHEPWFICGQPSSFVGGRLRFSGSRGGSGVVGGRWRSWAVTKVGGGEERGWRR